MSKSYRDTLNNESDRRVDIITVFTDFRLRIIESHKGNLNPGDEIVIPLMGGTIDGGTLHVSHAATLTVGENFIAALNHRARSDKTLRYFLTEGNDGKFFIETDAKTNKKIVKRIQGAYPLDIIRENGSMFDFKDSVSLPYEEFMTLLNSAIKSKN